MNLTNILSRIIYKRIINNYRTYSKHEHPFRKTWNLISNEIPSILGNETKKNIYPEHVDIVVIGGGFVGSSAAYWLKSRTAHGLSVAILEKDISYEGVRNNNSSTLCTLTQHFSLPENILLSQYSAEFFRNIQYHLGPHVDIKYRPTNNLVLACEKYAEKLEKNCELLCEHGLRSKLLNTDEISKEYPWMSMHDVKLGCMGTESEGFFSSWEFIKGLVTKTKELGGIYVNAEVIGFEMENQKDVLMEGVIPGTYERINKVVFRTPDNEEHSIKFAGCILAAGDNTGHIASLAKIGKGDGLLSVPLPIERRVNKVYSIDSATEKFRLNTPIVTDTSGLWLQRNGLETNLLCEHIPLITEETKNYTDQEYYENVVKPSIVNRIPSCESTEILQYSVGKQDCNTYDHTGILGPHPYHNNLYVAAGFGRQGCQHAPGLGRALAELIIDSRFVSIDLTRFGLDRILVNQPLVEHNYY